MWLRKFAVNSRETIQRFRSTVSYQTASSVPPYFIEAPDRCDTFDRHNSCFALYPESLETDGSFRTGDIAGTYRGLESIRLSCLATSNRKRHSQP